MAIRRYAAFIFSVCLVAFGLSAATTGLTLVESVLFRALPFVDPGTLAAFIAPLDVHRRLTSQDGAIERQRAEASPLIIDRTYIRAGFLTEPDATSHTDTSPIHFQVSGNFFAFLGVQPLIGRPLVASDVNETPAPAVLGYDLWLHKYAGDPQVVGGTVILSGVTLRVVGVASPSMAFPAGANVWTVFAPPVTMTPSLVRLAPGTQLPTLAAAFPKLDVQSIESLVRPAHPTDTAFILAVGVLALLVAIVQLVSISLGNALDRAQELWTRVALGAGRWNMWTLFARESCVVGLSGAVVSWTLIPGLSSVLAAALPFDVTRGQHVAVTPRVWAFSAVMTVAIVFALAVSAYSTAVSLGAPTLNLSRSRSSGARNGGRRLLIAQIALTAALLYLTGITARSDLALRNASLGFNPADLVLAWKPAGNDDFAASIAQAPRMDEAENVLRQYPGVTAVARSMRFPLEPGRFGGTLSLPGGVRFDPMSVRVNYISASYFSTLQARLLQGQAFTVGAGNDVAVVNEQLAKVLTPYGEVVGRRIRVTSFDGSVVGVVRNLANGPLDAPIEPEIFLQAPGMLARTFLIRTAPGTTLTEVSNAVAAAMRTKNVTVQAMSDYVSVATAASRVRSSLLIAVGCASLLIAMMGVVSSLLLSIKYRARELALRIALGATRGNIRRVVMSETARDVVCGLGVGLGFGIAAARVTQALLVHVSPFDALTLVVVLLVLLSSAALAAIYPVESALRIDPYDALRQV